MMAGTSPLLSPDDCGIQEHESPLETIVLDGIEVANDGEGPVVEYTRPYQLRGHGRSHACRVIIDTRPRGPSYASRRCVRRTFTAMAVTAIIAVGLVITYIHDYGFPPPCLQISPPHRGP